MAADATRGGSCGTPGPSSARARPALTIDFEPRFCGNHVADVTAGCSFGCLYCPFAELGARRRGVRTPVALDDAAVAALPSPPTVFLSPASDPFAPQAVPGTQRLLEHLLPRGTVVGLVTKGVIPEQTLALLAAHPGSVEGVGVGVTSLDDERNALLEPGCPPARARLENVDRLAARGIPVAVRMDPLLPDLDDAPGALAAMVDEAARRGAAGVTAAYVFAWGARLRRMRGIPRLAAACALLTERAPMEGGHAMSVPLARKLDTFARLDALTRSRGIKFSTCGCKDLRIAPQAAFETSCRNVTLLGEKGLGPTRRAATRAPAV